MSSFPQPKPRLGWTDWLLIIVFAGLIWLPSVDFFAHLDWTSPLNENRLPAPPPHLTHRDAAGVRDYLAATEAYFNDHFGFRRRLIRWSQQWHERLYRTGRGVDQVVVGQNGWIFFTEGRMINHFLGLEQFTPQQLQSWQRLLEKRRDWLAARGIKYLFVISPDKHTIYPEDLPPWLLNARAAGTQTKVDQFLKYMKEHSTVEILDLRPALLAGKKTEPLYLQNDSHWNLYGGFIGSQEVIKALSRQLPGLPPLRIEDFTWTNPPAAGGDLSVVLGTPEKPEKNYFAFAPKPPLVAPRITEITNIVRNWNPGDRAKVNTLVENTNLPGPPVDAVVFHDSYGKALRQFLGYSLHRIVMVWENQEFNTRVILQNHPQVVVNEMLERFFDTEDPEKMQAMEALP